MVEKSSAFWMCGSAMFTIVASSTTMSWQAAMTVSAMPGCHYTSMDVFCALEVGKCTHDGTALLRDGGTT